MGNWLYIFIASSILLLHLDEIHGVTIPKEILDLACKENEDPNCSPAMIRDVLTFASASALLCRSTTVRLVAYRVRIKSKLPGLTSSPRDTACGSTLCINRMLIFCA